MTARAEVPMPAWTDDELDRIGGAEELEIASLRLDGTLGPGVLVAVFADARPRARRRGHADRPAPSTDKRRVPR
jgi:hypothetical protein